MNLAMGAKSARPHCAQGVTGRSSQRRATVRPASTGIPAATTRRSWLRVEATTLSGMLAERRGGRRTQGSEMMLCDPSLRSRRRPLRHRELAHGLDTVHARDGNLRLTD